jgi:hypothetical protein
LRVYEGRLTNENSRIELRDLDSGIYFLNLWNEEINIVQKIVIQKSE